MTRIAAIPGLWVDLRRTRDGYEIAGQHLRGGGEYEYRLTIEGADVSAFAAALGVPPDEIAVAWEAQVERIAVEGEKTWLTRHDVPHGFFAHSS